METNQLILLAEVVLPTEVLKFFEITRVESNSSEIHIYLDEKKDLETFDNLHIESKGFTEVTSITDFPIRDHKVILKIRRRRWIDTQTGKSFSLPINLDITAKGTRYSKEFGAFLKETYGHVPDGLPYV